MNKEIRKVLAGALLVPLMFCIFWNICEYKFDFKEPGRIDEQEYSDEEKHIDVENIVKRGYVVYQDVPKAMVALCQNPDFANEYPDINSASLDVEYEDAGFSGEEEYWNNICADWNQITQETFMKQYKDLIVAEISMVNKYATLVFDPKKNCFDDAEKIQRIEQCGFTGFSEQLAKIETIIQKKTAAQKGEDEIAYWVDSSEEYDISCQGALFSISRVDECQFVVKVAANGSSCFAPEKYLSFIRGQIASGDYYLRSSCVGGEREVLTFGKNQSIEDKWAKEGEELEKESYYKNISFVFEEGKMVDYFVTTCGTELSMDEKDKAFLSAATSGLGKELSKTPITKGEEGDMFYWIYRAV